MVKRISALFIVALVASLTIDLVFGNASAPPAAKTGAPGEQTCATQCHTGTVNSGGGGVSILFNGGNNTYVQGQTYTVSVTVTDPNLSKFGFQITALTGGTGPSVGTFTLTNTTKTTTQLGNVGGVRRYVGHKNADTTNTWSFDWTAPTTISSPITFYAVGNATNANFGQSGDEVYTSNLTLDMTVGVEQQMDANLNVWPVPAKDFVNVGIDGMENVPAELNILDLSGKRVISKEYAPAHSTQQVDLSGLAPGMYLIQVRSEHGTAARKVVKE